MRRLLFTALLIIATTTLAQERRSAGSNDWVSVPEAGCIGGDTCRGRTLRIALQDRPVVAIRFHAHDEIGQKAGGELRLKIDSNVIRDSIDIPRRGQLFTIDVDELSGRTLTFEPASYDEVEIKDIAILYSRERVRDRDRVRRDPWDGGSRDRTGWQKIAGAGGCIGGDECRRNGNRITVALANAPVLGVRFFARDEIGQRAGGKLRVRIDDTAIGWSIDIERKGRRHELDVDSVVGSKLVIETASDDEVEVSEIEILYGRQTRRDRWEREVRHQGGCIGGSECGGRRRRIEIATHGRAIKTIRFHAHDQIGTRAGGSLRITLDDEVLEWGIDIPREGRNFVVNGGGKIADYVTLEAATDDEIELRDIRIEFVEEK